MTRGYRLTKIDTTAAMASEVAANAALPAPAQEPGGGDGRQDGDHLDQQGKESLARHDLGPDREAEQATAATGAMRRPTPQRTLAEGAGGLEREEAGPMRQAQHHHRDPT
jgi:hypothetical protein